MEFINDNWYVLYTKEGWERDVYNAITKRKIPAFLPLTTAGTITGSNTASPLFKSYVFVKATTEQIGKIKLIAGVINLLYWLDKPLQIADAEIKNLAEFVGRFTVKKVEKLAVEMGSCSSVIPCSSKGVDKIEVSSHIKLKLPFLGLSILAEGVPGNVRTIVKDKDQKVFKKHKAQSKVSLLTTE